MDSCCDRLIRCLCSCLIKKEIVQYAEVNDENTKFVPSLDQAEEDRHQKVHLEGKELFQQQLSDYLGDPPANNPAESKGTNIGISEEGILSIENQNLLQEEDTLCQDFSQVMSPEHPYYHLFKDKLVKLGSIFEIPTKASTASPETSFPLKLHCYQEGKHNIFVYFFKFPTDVDNYESISNDF